MITFEIEMLLALILIPLLSTSSFGQIPNVVYDSTTATRVLTNSEIATLRSSLKWSPARALVKLGESAAIQLLDGNGRVLASVRLNWNSLVGPDGNPEGSPRLAGVRLVLENNSRCTFTSSAELKTPGDATVLTASDWRLWTVQKHPAPGRSNELSTKVLLAKESSVLELAPADPTGPATLIACDTAEASSSRSPFDGLWIITTVGGPRPMESTFHVDGTKLTGTMKLGSGEIVPITSGVVKGDKISFSFPGQKNRTLYLAGSLAGDVIEMELAWGPGEYGSPFTAKRK